MFLPPLFHTLSIHSYAHAPDSLNWENRVLLLKCKISPHGLHFVLHLSWLLELESSYRGSGGGS